MIKDLNVKLRKLRQQNNYSQKDVAAKLGISPSVVSGYETGERTPSTEIILSLSYLYKCSTDYLLGKENIEPSVILDTDGLTPEQIQAIKNLIDTMKST